ncbi:hypothetical protein CORC01_09218 [Colletotrichum orchidophilum]|uniref:Uncharacterized protein n=1 Tax=Colletotrichum orchidophilum TaxID=1209926 RepID=A0A1G4B2C5_9PEZI|nr:uncharacterized protein CORC01_09218 [Colletotrichum orchidophilum]OHE95485.1 hypothetical protein CORC01_09218 [Colletotrichum orchidophilum]
MPAREVVYQLIAEDSTTELQTAPTEDSPELQRPAGCPASTGDWLRRTPALTRGWIA